MSSEQLKNHLRRNCLGRKNAVKSPELERTLRISGNELRRQVNRLRRKKVPICSGPEGYFYAGTGARRRGPGGGAGGLRRAPRR